MPLGIHIPRKYLKPPNQPPPPKSYTPTEEFKRPHHRSKPSTLKEPLVFLADGVSLLQERGLRPPIGQVGFAAGSCRGAEKDLPAVSDEPMDNNKGIQGPYLYMESTFDRDTCSEVQPRISRHCRRRFNQARRWVEEVIPGLIRPYLSLVEETKCFSLNPSESPPEDNCTCREGVSRLITISMVRFQVIESTQLNVCLCRPAANQLVAMGFFPSTPLIPTLAIDIRVLEFVSRLFLNLVPNTTAWCRTLEEFLEFQGYKLARQNSLRKRFGEALRWYTVLQDYSSYHITVNQTRIRESITHYKNGILFSPFEPQGSSDRPESSRGVSAHVSTQSNVLPVEHTPSPLNLQSIEDGGWQTSQNNSQSQKRRHGAVEDHSESDDDGHGNCNPFPNPLPRSRPSDYLRSRCSLCFGGEFPRPGDQTGPDAIVCIDACFKQKRNKGSKDPENIHPSTLFVPESCAKQMDVFIETVRPARQSSKPAKRARKEERPAPSDEPDNEDDGYDGSLRVPRSVLATCQESFTAADESRQKASTQFFSETALMALLCRHDHVLWVVSMTSAGEKQHYTLTLIETLFQHLPLWFKVGLMYDIGCQLHQSCVKWGFLSRYLDRLTFAVSVFHAFGHHWACQIIYHPRKCVGFGLSDGEGCERFWKSIQNLIPHLRVCGHYQRMYTLDRQILNSEKDGQRKLGEWLLRRTRHTHQKRLEAEKLIQDSGNDIEFLRNEWKKQVDSQTKPLPRQTKNKGKDAVEHALHLRKSRDILRRQIRQFEDGITSENSEGYLIAEAEMQLPDLCERLDQTIKRLRAAESALGVDGRRKLDHLLSDPFIGARMNARALKIRLREKLRARKFELDRLERSFRHQVNERKVDEHTQSSVQRRDPGIKKLASDYNKLCRIMYNIKAQGKAPRGSICPEEIDMKGLFSLDVDDTIWQDIGLDESLDAGDPRVQVSPPLWLCDDRVRLGIRGMLELDRCKEEETRLDWECCALKAWFREEWAVVSRAHEESDSSEMKYQLLLRKKSLISLLLEWQRSLQSISSLRFDISEWGPTENEILTARVSSVTATFVERHGDNDSESEIEDSDSEEEMLDSILIDTLEAVDLADAFREHN